MDDDKFALVEKILKDVENVMSKNADLCAFDVVPVESNFQNKSPVLHLENCLGLESWCVKHVYMYCYSELMDKYLAKSKRRISKPVVNSERLPRFLNVTLLLNPEVSSLWNKRREMVLKNLLDKSSELQFTKLVLSRKPKCNDAFAYRRWLLEAIFKDSVESNYIENIINEELRVSELASDKSPNNYHSWNHRIWIVNTVKEIRSQYDQQYLFMKEYAFSEKWTSRHISDFSCFHYRQFCIKNIYTIDDEHWRLFENTIDVNLRKNFVRVLSLSYPDDVATQISEDSWLLHTEENLIILLLGYSSKNCNCVKNNVVICRKLEVLFYELVLNNELLRFYKGHETLWYHRRFIIHEIIAIMYNHFDLVRENGVLVKKSCRKCDKDSLRQKQVKMVRYDSNRIYSSILFKILLNHEKRFIEERSNDSDNYADRHEKYLKFVEGLNNVFE